jgi:hypothetical protein
MLRLSIDTRPRWLELPHGVRVEVRPLTTAVEQAAHTEADNRLAMLKKQAEDAAAAGQALDPTGPNGANAAWMVGQRVQMLVEALARYGITAWKGLGGDDGASLPLSAEAFAAFAAHRDLGAAFYAEYRAPVAALAAEGNVSGSTADGGGAMVPSTAPDATAAPSGLTVETTVTAHSAPTAPAP